MIRVKIMCYSGRKVYRKEYTMGKFKTLARKAGAFGVFIVAYALVWILAYYAGVGIGKLVNKITGNE